MKTIIIFLTTLFISFSIYAEKLTIYTYDSFVSEWGPGPIIEKIFEEKHNADIEFVAVDSAATLLNKVILEGDTSMEVSPSKITLFNNVAALSTATNSISALCFSSNIFSIMGPGPHSDTKESYV